MTKRQPSGTPVGGQFAPDRKPEGADLVVPQRGQVVETKSWTQDELIRIKVLYAKRVAEHNRESPGYAYEWYDMERTMTACGGVAAVPPLLMETDIPTLVSRGVISVGDALIRKGRPNACHENTARLWIDGKIDKIQTGYALSEDGLWRQHSWGVKKNGQQIETTEPRLAYFGYEVENPEEWANNQI